MVSIIIPAYNEAQAIGDTLRELSEELSTCGFEYEVLVINDGSSDDTESIVRKMENEHIRCISHRVNRGYGSAIVTGVKNARGGLIIWYDADGQHRPEDLIRVVKKMKEENLDYCIGVRSSTSYQVKNRVFGKFILKKIVNLLAREPMQDFNSGMRAFKREVLLKYVTLLPKRFGASTISSFIMQEAGNYAGGEITIEVRSRTGKSTVRPLKDGMRTLMLIMDIILLFRPAEVFGSIGIFFIAVGVVYGVALAVLEGLGIPVLSAILCMGGIQTVFLGIILSQISRLRLDNLDNE
ncbi:MAG: glycosyltransferase family 2 protein [Lachnospiraceae bacterium]|nr:glycosyltransferase family 2 protein [Lachnospiraceae bacterium]